MRIIDEMVGEFRFKIYKNKFKSFCVSPEIATIPLADDGINIIKMINSSPNYSYLKDSIIVDLLGPRENDYLIFSLLFGLFFDAFNLYNYMYIEPDVRRDIALSDPNMSETSQFFREHDKELFAYFEEEYGIDYETYQRIVDSLFYVKDENSALYNNPIIVDISKILFGKTLIKNFIGCRSTIELFDERNKIKLEKKV